MTFRSPAVRALKYRALDDEEKAMPLRLAATTGQEQHDGWMLHHGRVIPRPCTPVSPAFGARVLQRVLRTEATAKRDRPARRTKRTAA